MQRSYFHPVRDRISEVVGSDLRINPTTAAFAVITMCDRVTVCTGLTDRWLPRDLADQYSHLFRGMLRLGSE